MREKQCCEEAKIIRHGQDWHHHHFHKCSYDSPMFLAIFCRHGLNLALLIKYFSIIVSIRFFKNGQEKVGTGISISNTNNESMTLTTYYYIQFQKIASCTKVKAAFTYLCFNDAWNFYPGAEEPGQPGQQQQQYMPRFLNSLYKILKFDCSWNLYFL